MESSEREQLLSTSQKREKKLEVREFVTFRQHFIVVAHEGNVKDWAAYVDNDYTRKRGNAKVTILRDGYKLKHEDAVKVFPDWDTEFTWRL